MDAVRARHQSVIQLYFTLGGYGPTFGIIGTVMGLVTVLGHLDDPSELGHAIAVAFIACLVGVASANVLWFPVSSSLKHQHEAEMAEMDLIVTGTLNLQGRRGGERTITGAALKELLDSTVEPKAKITFKRADGGGDGGGGGDGDGGGAT
jgi:chemotaxis protein MotA